METEDAIPITTSLGINSAIIYFIRSMLMPTALFGDGNASTFTIVVDVVLTCCTLFCLGKMIIALSTANEDVSRTLLCVSAAELLSRIVLFVVHIYLNNMGSILALVVIGVVFNPAKIESFMDGMGIHECDHHYFWIGTAVDLNPEIDWIPPWTHERVQCLKTLRTALMVIFIRGCFVLLLCMPFQWILK